MLAAAAAAAGPVASAPAGSLSSSGSLGLAGSAGMQSAGAVKLQKQKQEEMPAELRISAARAERKKKTEERLRQLEEQDQSEDTLMGLAKQAAAAGAATAGVMPEQLSLEEAKLQAARGAYTVLQQALQNEARLVSWYRSRAAGLPTAAIAAAIAAAGPDASVAAAAGGGSSAAAAGQTAAAQLQTYKARVRMLCTGLRYPDGVSPELIAGDRSPDEVAVLDALALAPAAVQEAVQRRREAQARGEAAWESMMGSGSVGGGGTHLSTEVACPSCGEKRAQVHTILSGGTYAQERVQIQKYVCQGCSQTWRSDD